MSNRTINIGLCGFGVVGQGVYDHLKSKRQALRELLGADMFVTRIAVRDLSKKRDVEIDESSVSNDPIAIATDPSIDIVCELMGGTEIAREVTIAALKASKIVVTANKALLCDHGRELLSIAQEFGGHLLFEASVAGGIPVIKAIREGLVINDFSSIYGILNGTCNYILTRMAKEGLSYQEILVEAKKLGYAEADESLDVDGVDAAHKAVVLAYLAHGKWVDFKNVRLMGIKDVSQEDIRFAKDNGYAVKLIAVVNKEREGKALHVSVLPTLVEKTSSLGSVDGVYNAVSVHGDVVGETVYIGPGAGRHATASAVISDVVDAAKLLIFGGPEGRFPFLDSAPKNGGGIEVARPSEIQSRYYIRLVVMDQPGVMAEIASILASHQVSLASVAQKEVPEKAERASLIITTHLTTEEAIQRAVADLGGLATLEEEPFCMPIGTIS
ncbi:homoserine dehydrogenase [Candidatus Pelagisphaera phototrophica]|uniref:homoserine dehydrogenase n=1 Tax=Candidatus Pelagisphaera phototrophica TaxID=2684113 RepID=UPI001A0A9D02|nr:homoserine dehydrogenase [Candidatus Pelagisphaera phototrophica]QXD32025.1 homoserine dehydrogenase [Candidatus Pelagisphaera phototrophica]